MLRPMATPTPSSIGEGHFPVEGEASVGEASVGGEAFVGGASCPDIPEFTTNQRTKQLSLVVSEE